MRHRVGAVTARRAGAAALLASAVLAGSATPAVERFDHVAVTSAAALPPVDLVALDGAGRWRTTPVDAFPTPGGGSELHLRVRDLGVPTDERPPGARWAVHARRERDGETRAGFLVPRTPGAPAGAPLGRLDADSFASERLSLAFPDGSGFYRDLRIAGAPAPLVRAIRLRVTATLPAGIEVTRSDRDFRWRVTALDVGTRFARRDSTASVRALVRYTDPRAQTALLANDLIAQRVRIDLPRSLLALASDVVLENGFEVDARTMVLLPDASAWQRPSELPVGRRYTWIALAGGAGALVHRLVPEGAAASLAPALHARARDGGARWEVGYRVAYAERAAGSGGPQGAGGDHGFVLGQHVAILGDGAWAEAVLADPARTQALARELSAELAHPLPAWRATLDEVAP
ncbi:MAG: hypothetical protein AB1689_27590 [Thermodesulfobacteriota bacterium]